MSNYAHKDYSKSKFFLGRLKLAQMVKIPFIVSGADAGFFFGGGAPLRNDVTDDEVKTFKSENVYTKKKLHLRGGRGKGGAHPCTLPLDPPLSFSSSTINFHEPNFDFRTLLHYLHFIQVSNPFIIYSHLPFLHVTSPIAQWL